jgi:RNA polymerase subunit RPABC4/transcription elongation factor Spt4
MEITCNRCHQTVLEENSYCPACGLPQLVYTAEGAPEQANPERADQPVRDASEVDWKKALQVALMLAVPTGLLCSLLSPLGILILPLMFAAGAWVVVLYVRSQRPAWITSGAGARIGLVTGVLGGWTAAAATAFALFAMRFIFHQGTAIDDFWQNKVVLASVQQWTTMGVDAQTILLMKTWLLSPTGRGGWALGALSFLIAGLLIFAVAGGAVGARVLARTRRPEI